MLTVKAKRVLWKSSILRGENDERINLVLLKKTGAFAIPLTDDGRYTVSCKLAYQNRQIDARPLSLDQRMEVKITADANSALDLKYTLGAEWQTGVKRKRRAGAVNGTHGDESGDEDDSDDSDSDDGRSGSLGRRNTANQGRSQGVGRARGAASRGPARRGRATRGKVSTGGRPNPTGARRRIDAGVLGR